MSWRTAPRSRPQRLSPIQRLLREMDRRDLERLERDHHERGVPSPSVPGDGVIQLTVRPRRTPPDHDWRSEARPIRTRAHALLLALLVEHVRAVRDPRRVKLRRQALAWVLEDVAPSRLDYVFSFESLCSEFDLGLGWARRAIMRLAVAAELERRQRLLARRGRVSLSLDPIVIESELHAAAHAIIEKRRTRIADLEDIVELADALVEPTDEFIATFTSEDEAAA